MLHKASKEIYRALSSIDGLKVFTDDNDKVSVVWLKFGNDNGGSYRIQFFSTDDDNDVGVRVFGIARIPENKRPQIYKILCELNAEYRFFKFTCDDDGDIALQYDFFVNGNPADCAGEVVYRINNVLEKAYPRIMRAVWA